MYEIKAGDKSYALNIAGVDTKKEKYKIGMHGVSYIGLTGKRSAIIEYKDNTKIQVFKIKTIIYE